MKKTYQTVLFFIAGGMFLFALLIIIKLINIQFVDGKKYRDLAKKKYD